MAKRSKAKGADGKKAGKVRLLSALSAALAKGMAKKRGLPLKGDKATLGEASCKSCK